MYTQNKLFEFQRINLVNHPQTYTLIFNIPRQDTKYEIESSRLIIKLETQKIQIKRVGRVR